MIRTTFDDPVRGLAVVVGILLVVQPLLVAVQGVARSARRRAPVARRSTRAGRVRCPELLAVLELTD